MLPINVDLARIRVILVGDGAAACRRLDLLDRAGAGELEVYAANPTAALDAAAGQRLRHRLPDPEEIARAQLVFLAGLDEPAAGRIRRIATIAGVLLNVEDDVARSDFHSPAVVRRGDLTVAISTNGKSPGLAAALRRDLEDRFGSEWQARLDRMAALRAAWREAGADAPTIARWTAQWLAREDRIAS
jgi:precorrin-2 dehydrogenase